MKLGKFISIEGSEGAGKTTAINFLKAYFKDSSQQLFWTREPGGTPFAERLRDIVLHAKETEKLTSEAELLIMFAARAQHIEIIREQLQQGNWVISDRFIDATYAYQGGGRKLAIEHINYLEHWLVQGCLPDLTLLLDVKPEIGLARTMSRGNEQDRIESERQEFFIAVRQAYLDRAKEFPQRIKIIDASLSLVDVETQLKNYLDEFIGKSG